MQSLLKDHTTFRQTKAEHLLKNANDNAPRDYAGHATCSGDVAGESVAKPEENNDVADGEGGGDKKDKSFPFIGLWQGAG